MVLQKISLVALTAFTCAFSRDEMLQRPEQPPMEEIRNYLSHLVDEPGIPVTPDGSRGGQGHNPRLWLEVLIEGLPALIADAEKTFPGLRYAFLGRDVRAIADGVDAFYLAHGYPGRVARIGGSKASFRNVDKSTIVKFIQSYGWNYKTLHRDRPFVLIDSVSSGVGTQGRQILEALYVDYAASGGNARDLVRKLNMLGLVVSTFPSGHPQYLTKDAEHHLSTMEHDFSHKKSEFFTNKRILMFPEPIAGKLFNESGYIHFVTGWGQPYGPFISQNGALRPQVGAHYDISWRKTVLWMQREIWKRVSTPEFLHAVEREALRRGYTFDFSDGRWQPSTKDPSCRDHF